MADDYLFYEEDYEDISDWDEASDENNNDKTNVDKSDCRGDAHRQHHKEEQKQKVATTRMNRDRSANSIANSLAVPYIPTSTSASFIVHKYAVLTSKELKQQMQDMISSIASTLNIEDEMVSLLLRRYEWKTERLMENYLFDSMKCLRQHNLHLIDGKEANINRLPLRSVEIECPICVSDVKLSDTFSLGCNHRFCTECWSDYVASTINNKSFHSILIECPGHKCVTPLKNSVIRRFCADNKEWSKYENYMVASYVTCNEQSYRFCPAPGCKYIIYCNDVCAAKSDRKEDDKESKDGFEFFGQNRNKKVWKNKQHSQRERKPSVFVQCRCGYDLCFLCLEEYHAPATCQQVENWNFKCLKESDNAQWIVTNTKKCPKCFTRIERNHGCNHMVCTKCQYEFCWVCMGSWKEHGIGTGGYYRCNKYKPKSSMGNKQKLQAKEDEELDKFVHYFNRFHNHAQSKQFLLESSHKVLRKIKTHFNTKSNNNKSWIDVEFLQNAHDEIFFCRQILKYTYVFAYYLTSGAEKDLFEFLQQDLEKNCEILHELCEQNWKNINATHIINYTNITHRFVKQLLDGIAKGLTT